MIFYYTKMPYLRIYKNKKEHENGSDWNPNI